MPVFRFKRFEVSNDRSAMKVNTDGVLLGALMTVSSHDRRLLDIGTGRLIPGFRPVGTRMGMTVAAAGCPSWP